MFDKSVIEKIIFHWESDQNHPYRGVTKREIPDLENVQGLVELAFLASLKREEEQPINAVLVLGTQEEIGDDTHKYRKDIFKLKNPILLTPDSLGKISPAFDTRTTSLIVTRDAESGDFICWGVSRFVPSLNRFTELPIARLGGDSFRLDLFTVTIQSPGSLLISRKGANVGRFVNGDFEPAKPTPFTSNSLGDYIIESISGDKLTHEHGNRYWHLYRDSLDTLLFECSRRGHGGTIVVLPEKYDDNCLQKINSKYSLSPSPGMIGCFKNALKHPNRKEITLSISENMEIYESIKFLAQLAAIDGALVLRRDMSLVSFGATLNADEWKGKVVEGSDGFGVASEKTFPHQRFGTRHNSAINFSGEIKGAISFVISQDGPIRAFLSVDDRTVMCWPDCSASMFV